MEHYLWLKALHIIAAIAWMAGMLYLPRIYVYHCGAAAGSDLAETFKVMERRLLRAIINPAMIATWLLGLALAWRGDLWGQPWFHVKLALVLALSGYHGLLARWRRQFANEQNSHGPVFYRMMNEAPTVLMIAIVILAVVEPF